MNNLQIGTNDFFKNEIRDDGNTGRQNGGGWADFFQDLNCLLPPSNMIHYTEAQDIPHSERKNESTNFQYNSEFEKELFSDKIKSSGGLTSNTSFEERNDDTKLEKTSSWDTYVSTNTIHTINSAYTTDSEAILGKNAIRMLDDTQITLDDFGVSSKDGEDEADAIQIDDSRSEISQDEVVPQKPLPMDEGFSAVYDVTLDYIANQNWRELVAIILKYPKILAIPFNKREYEANSPKAKVRGCYGGTLLHVLVSQKPYLMKKRIKKKIGSSSNKSYEVHIIYPVPQTLLTKVMKRFPIALQMVDEFGRTPLHCAVITLHKHLEEMNKHYGETKDMKSYDVARFVVRMANNIYLLLRSNREVAAFSDCRGNLPLHYAAGLPPDFCDPGMMTSKAKGLLPTARDTVKMLLDTFPRGISQENTQGRLPIHVICSRGKNLNLPCLRAILFIHSIQRETPTGKDAYGDSPLHIAIKSRAPHTAIAMFTSFDPVSSPARLFVQRDENNDTPLQIALRLKDPPPSSDMISVILSTAPFTASTPDEFGVMPIRHATRLKMANCIIKTMLAQDMPIELGLVKDSSTINQTDVSNRSPKASFGDLDKKIVVSSQDTKVGQAIHIVERPHHHSWWHVAYECEDSYLSAIFDFLSEKATHQQIITLSRQVGPDGKKVLIEEVSDKCRFIFSKLLRFYDRYEILLNPLSSEVTNQSVGSDVQVFHALDYGFNSPNVKNQKIKSANNPHEETTPRFTSVKHSNAEKRNASVEVSFFDSNEKCEVILRCYKYEEAFLAELKVREKYNISTRYLEQILNYHRDETYTHLTLSEAEKMCCITFERYDHTLADVFANISARPRSVKWFNKCCVVLRQIGLALNQFHKCGIIHGHVEPENVAKYGNSWKLINAARVTEIGMSMRGPIRGCVPPESIMETSELVNSHVEELGLRWSPKKDNIASQRVKFANESTEGQPLNKTRVKFANDGVSSGNSGWSSRKQIFGFSSRNKNTSNDAMKTKQKPFSKMKSFYHFDEGKEQSLKQSLTFAPQNCTATVAWDMWGFGLIMLQILAGRSTHVPNFERAEDALISNLHSYSTEKLIKIYENVRNTVGQRAADLVARLLHPDPDRRPESMEWVLNHDYFSVVK